MELEVTLSTNQKELNADFGTVIGGGTKNYNRLENKPSINGIALDGNKSSADLGLLDANTKIPTKISDLHDDSSFIKSEIDPTVPIWAKMPTKPIYTPDEVGIVVNPEGDITGKLTKIKIGNDILGIEAAGTNVEANPEGEATIELTKIKIGNIIYSVPEGGTTYINVSDSEEDF